MITLIYPRQLSGNVLRSISMQKLLGISVDESSASVRKIEITLGIFCPLKLE